MRREAARRAERGLSPVVRMYERKGLRARLGWWLRCMADRIDSDGAMRGLYGTPGWSFTYEKCPHQVARMVFREDGLGTKLWYFGPDVDRAWEEADADWWPEGWER